LEDSGVVALRSLVASPFTVLEFGLGVSAGTGDFAGGVFGPPKKALNRPKNEDLEGGASVGVDGVVVVESPE